MACGCQHRQPSRRLVSLSRAVCCRPLLSTPGLHPPRKQRLLRFRAVPGVWKKGFISPANHIVTDPMTSTSPIGLMAHGLREMMARSFHRASWFPTAVPVERRASRVMPAREVGSADPGEGHWEKMLSRTRPRPPCGSRTRSRRIFLAASAISPERLPSNRSMRRPGENQVVEHPEFETIVAPTLA